MSQDKQRYEASSRQFFYQGYRLVIQIQGSSTHTVLGAGNHVLAQLRGGASGRQAQVLVTDGNHSVLGAAEGGLRRPFAYLPYGFHPVSRDNCVLPGFNGEARDTATGHYFLGRGYRLYNPRLMRFHSPDSLSPFDDGGLNTYAYVNGDPVNQADPTGHMPGHRRLVRRGSSPELELRASLNSPDSQSSLPYSEPGSLSPLPDVGFSRVGSLTRSLGRSAGRRWGAMSDRNFSGSGSSHGALSISSLASSGSRGSSGSVQSIGITQFSQVYERNVMAYLGTIEGLATRGDGWSISKSHAYFTKELNPVEQFKFDIFQNAIHHYRVPPGDAARLMGDSNHKQLGSSGIWQVRLSQGGRMTYVLEEKRVVIRDVGGHT